MNLRLAPVEDGVSHTADVGGHVDLGPQAVLLTHRTPLLHLLPNQQVLLHTCHICRGSQLNIKCYFRKQDTHGKIVLVKLQFNRNRIFWNFILSNCLTFNPSKMLLEWETFLNKTYLRFPVKSWLYKKTKQTLIHFSLPISMLSHFRPTLLVWSLNSLRCESSAQTLRMYYRWTWQTSSFWKRKQIHYLKPHSLLFLFLDSLRSSLSSFMVTGSVSSQYTLPSLISCSHLASSVSKWSDVWLYLSYFIPIMATSSKITCRWTIHFFVEKIIKPHACCCNSLVLCWAHFVESRFTDSKEGKLLGTFIHEL